MLVVWVVFTSLCVKSLSPDLIIGLTATPIDRLGVYIDNSMDLIEETTTKLLIESGELAKPVYKVPSLISRNRLQRCKNVSW